MYARSFFLILLHYISHSYTHVVTIRNDIPRLDEAGSIVNAHDGCVQQFVGVEGFFMYGTVYENCTQPGPECDGKCGYTPNRFSLYTSPDLASWKLYSDNIMPAVMNDNDHINYWMPNVFRNPRTGKYLMQYWSSHCGFSKKCAEIAISDSPFGPFVPTESPLSLQAVPSSQMGMFVEDNGDAYVKYNTVNPQHHMVEKLAPDWLSTTGNAAVIFWKESFPWYEGGGLFKRGDLYYYMTGSDCCFCSWGGNAQYWTAREAMGPWHPGVAPPLPTESCNLDGEWTSSSGKSISLTQQQGSDNFTSSDVNGTLSGWIDQRTGYIIFSGEAQKGVITSSDGVAAGCDRIRWYGYENFIWCRQGHTCSIPSAMDSPDLNACTNAQTPVYMKDGHRVNPCDPFGRPSGTNFTVPAQQFNVIRVRSKAGDSFLYYGERSKSAPDGLKSHNFQAWVPLQFSEERLLPLTFPQTFELQVDAHVEFV